MKRSFLITILFASAIVTATAQRPTVSEFFDRFTAEWIRQSPNQAIGARYFSGAEQQALDRQLTPQTDEWPESPRACEAGSCGTRHVRSGANEQGGSTLR